MLRSSTRNEYVLANCDKTEETLKENLTFSFVAPLSSSLIVLLTVQVIAKAGLH